MLILTIKSVRPQLHIASVCSALHHCGTQCNAIPWIEVSGVLGLQNPSSFSFSNCIAAQAGPDLLVGASTSRRPVDLKQGGMVRGMQVIRVTFKGHTCQFPQGQVIRVSFHRGAW